MPSSAAQTLLPPNSTKFERDLASVTESAVTLPVRIRDLWNPQTCPADTLPWLAWSLSVEGWDTNWTEKQKRAAIAASVSVHRAKGTLGSLRRALSALGYEVEINENTGEAHTFRIAINAGGQGIDAPAIYADARRIVLANKNARSHLAGVDALVPLSGVLYVGVTTATGDTTTILPEYLRSITFQAPLHVAICIIKSDTVTILPEPRAALAWPGGTLIAWPDGSTMTI